MRLDQSQIEDFETDGAVLIKGLFRDWVQTIQAGIEKNMAEPGPYAAENLNPGESGALLRRLLQLEPNCGVRGRRSRL